MKILSFGEIIFDIYNNNVCVGGAPLNFCAHSVKAGAKGYLISAVGDDALGKLAFEALKRYRISDAYVSILKNYSTGICEVCLDETGVPEYLISDDSAYDHIPFDNVTDFNGFDAFYFGTLALRRENNMIILKDIISKCKFKEICVDLNIRVPFYSCESIIMCLKNATIVKVSDVDLQLVTEILFNDKTSGIERFLLYLKENFKQIKIVVLTCGSEGSVTYDIENGNTYYQKALKTKVVSTVGAGDSFLATFLVNYLAGRSPEYSLEEASKVSAYVVSKEEAVPL